MVQSRSAAVTLAAVAVVGSMVGDVLAQTPPRLLGIDVSDWQDQNSQGPINWTRVHQPFSAGGGGRDFAFIRSSRGGTVGFYDEHDPNNHNGLNTGAQRYDDYAFEYNITEAKRVGMYAGPYHFARADILTYQWNGQTVVHTAADEANHFIEAAGPWMKPGYFLPVFDFEAGAAQRSTDELTAYALEFAARLKEVKGIVPIIYSSTSYASEPADESNGFTGSGNRTGEIRPAVAEAMPNLWLARWPYQAGNPNYDYREVEALVHTVDPIPADGYPNAYGVWNPSYPDTPSPHPWKFWQYSSRGRVEGIGFGNVNVDLDVAHGGHEFVKDYLVPALWTSDSDGNWATISKWNTDADPSGRGPAARLPGGDDTVILDRPGSVGVTISSAVPSIRKLYLREGLQINSGGSLAVTYVPSPDSTPESVQISSGLNLQDGASFSAHTIHVNSARIMMGAASLTFNTLQLSGGSGMDVTDSYDESQSPTFAGFEGGTATISYQPVAGRAAPYIYFAGGRGGLSVVDGAADIDLAVNVPLVTVGGPITKYGAGTLALGAPVQTNEVVVQRGILLVTGNNQLGSGPVSTRQTVVTPGVSGYGGTVQLSGNVSYNQPLTIAGGGVNGVSASPGGTTGALDNRSGDNNWTGAITLAGTGVNGDDPLENQIGSTAGTLRLSGVIQNAPGVNATWAKTGAGDVVLTGAAPNTYTGLTRQFGGRLIVEKDGALGSSGSPGGAGGNTFQIAGSASTLAFRAPAGSSGFTYSTFEVLNTHGTGAPGFGQIDNLSGDNTFTGQIAIGGPVSGVAQVGSIGVTSGSLTLSGGIYSRGSGRRIINKLGGGTLVIAGNGLAPSGNPAVVVLDVSTFNVSAGTVALTGTPTNRENMYGVHTWNVAAAATLRLHQGGAVGPATVNLDGGTLTVAAPMLVRVNAIGANGGAIDTAGHDAIFAGAVSGAGGLTKTGAGVATLAGAVNRISGGALAINGGTLAVAPGGDVSRMMTVNSIAIATGARLDLADNDILVDYAAGDSPYETLRGYIRAGRAGAEGIVSSISTGDTVLALGDNADLHRAAHRDAPIDTSTIIGMHTYYGDANLDGKVTGDDYVAVDSNLGIGSRWTQGDFNFDGIVSGDDYVAIDANLGKGTVNAAELAALKQEMIAIHAAMFGESYLTSLAIAEAEGFSSLVPEPGGLIVLPIALCAMSRRRRA